MVTPTEKKGGYTGGGPAAQMKPPQQNPSGSRPVAQTVSHQHLVVKVCGRPWRRLWRKTFYRQCWVCDFKEPWQ